MEFGPARMAPVLIVDDDPGNPPLLSQKLSQRGFEYEGCFRGHEALERPLRERFDIVVSDLRMPGPNGFELSKEVRAEFRPMKKDLRKPPHTGGT